MFAWILNTKPVKASSSGRTARVAAAHGTRRRGVFDEAVEHFLHAEVGQRRAEEHRGQSAGPVFLQIERVAGTAHQVDFVAQGVRPLRAQSLIDFRMVETLEGVAGVDAAIAGGVVKVDEILIEMVDALQFPAHADGPGDRRAADLEDLLDLVQQFDGFAAIPVQLIDEGEDRGIAQPADFHQLDGALLDAPRAVDHHQRRIHGGQGAVGVLGEVFVTGGVEQVDDAVAVGELHHRGGDRDPTLLLQRHPVAGGVAGGLAALDRAGQLNGTAEQQQLFGQRGLAGVGVRDDGEGAAALKFVEEGGHYQSGG
jgi:hypothetical protein